MKGLSRTTRRVVVCLAIGLVVGTSCGDDDESSSTAAATTVGEATGAAPTVASVSPATSSSTPAASTGSGDMCPEREALSSSVSALGDVDLVAEGTNGVTAAVDAVKDDLAALGDLSAQNFGHRFKQSRTPSTSWKRPPPTSAPAAQPRPPQPWRTC